MIRRMTPISVRRAMRLPSVSMFTSDSCMMICTVMFLRGRGNREILMGARRALIVWYRLFCETTNVSKFRICCSIGRSGCVDQKMVGRCLYSPQCRAPGWEFSVDQGEQRCEGGDIVVVVHATLLRDNFNSGDWPYGDELADVQNLCYEDFGDTLHQSAVSFGTSRFVRTGAMPIPSSRW
ncbi:hypothetical protein BKA93DRAFT_89910 [Sparassis latifolia]